MNRSLELSYVLESLRRQQNRDGLSYEKYEAIDSRIKKVLKAIEIEELRSLRNKYRQGGNNETINKRNT